VVKKDPDDASGNKARQTKQNLLNHPTTHKHKHSKPKEESDTRYTRTYMTVSPLDPTIAMFQIISHNLLIGLPFDVWWRSTNDADVDGLNGD
jgi:hypothetical protein